MLRTLFPTERETNTDLVEAITLLLSWVIINGLTPPRGEVTEQAVTTLEAPAVMETLDKLRLRVILKKTPLRSGSFSKKGCKCLSLIVAVIAHCQTPCKEAEEFCLEKM